MHLPLQQSGNVGVQHDRVNVLSVQLRPFRSQQDCWHTWRQLEPHGSQSVVHRLRATGARVPACAVGSAVAGNRGAGLALTRRAGSLPCMTTVALRGRGSVRIAANLRSQPEGLASLSRRSAQREWP